MIDNITFAILTVALVSVLVPMQFSKDNSNYGVVRLEEVRMDESNISEIQCLASNIYFEARNQSKEGMEAVANVVMNRVNDTRWPQTLCGVVYEKCQFSWTCEKPKYIVDIPSYDKSYAVAESAINGSITDNTKGSTFYHLKTIRPYWAAKFKRTTEIGDHIFYRG